MPQPTRFEPFRILLLAGQVFKGHGGIECFNRLLCRAICEFAEHQRKVKLYVLSRNDSNSSVNQDYLHSAHSEFHGCEGRLYAFLQDLGLQASRNRPHLVLACLVNYAPLANLLRAIGKTNQYAVVIHGMEVWRRLPYAKRRGLQAADFVLSVSEFSARKAQVENGVDPSKIRVLPNGLDPYWFAEARGRRAQSVWNDEGGSLLLSVGRLEANEQYKGIDRVIEAVGQVRQSIPSVRYVIVGDGSDRPRLEGLAARMGVHDIVRFVGAVPDRELHGWYEECAIFVLPSRGEGFGIVFLEAMAYGKPVIAGWHGGTPEVVEHGETGVLVRHDDVTNLAREITALLQDRHKRHQLGDGGLRRLEEQFTYECFQRRLWSFLESL